METALPDAPSIDVDPHPVVIVASRYNPEFTDGLLVGAQRELEALLPNAEIDIFRVPGAFEIPVTVEALCRRAEKKPAAVLALGVIIRGKTAHADLIASSITESLASSARTHLIPVIHEVLLVDSPEHAAERSSLDSPINRGAEAGRAAASMIGLFKTLHAS
ncbi:MAG: 6,7-dimethyl-8-ribityllumazine synthase [Verrucomicrobiae bacterium]|nr:6,7-dimethyl-8-ribityllumazine synthase [Verrucomicrobiae bacterium]